MTDHRTDREGDTIREAMKLMDPSGTLQPGTMEYKVIRDMILRWISECGLEYALCMAKVCAERFERWRKYF